MKNQKIKLFLVDDDELFSRLLELEFKQHADFAIESFASGEHCILSLAQNPDVIILDYWLNGTNPNAINGIEILDRIKAFNPDIPIIILSAQPTIDIAIECMHHRAFDYVTKNDESFRNLRKILSRIFRFRRMEKELLWYQ